MALPLRLLLLRPLPSSPSSVPLRRRPRPPPHRPGLRPPRPAGRNRGRLPLDRTLRVRALRRRITRRIHSRPILHRVLARGVRVQPALDELSVFGGRRWVRERRLGGLGQHGLRRGAVVDADGLLVRRRGICRGAVVHRLARGVLRARRTPDRDGHRCPGLWGGCAWQRRVKDEAVQTRFQTQSKRSSFADVWEGLQRLDTGPHIRVLLRGGTNGGQLHLAGYLYDRLDVGIRTAGVLAAVFGLMNLVSRPLGGVVSGAMGRRFGMKGRLWSLYLVQTLAGLLCVFRPRLG
ncbi:High affinity nitrate transporter 2.7 [Acorus gramineus]|uniref:High affinity nitrate transporter 2.7 n=1 Tax=Acorus gramineus TaxID=55184 RepID=A0AAV9B0Y0_ACOGR|nr:High affinity nitrate transporter 2.7 [Acorus gramineus]